MLFKKPEISDFNLTVLIKSIIVKAGINESAKLGFVNILSDNKIVNKNLPLRDNPSSFVRNLVPEYKTGRTKIFRRYDVGL